MQIGHSIDEYASEGTGIDSSVEAHAHESRITKLPISVDLSKRTEATATEQPRLPPKNWPRTLSIYWGDEPYDMLSLFCKPTYPVRISVVYFSNVMLTLAILVDTKAGPSFG